MSVHDRDGAAEPRPVCGFHDFEPLSRFDLVGADHGADLVVEDLRRGPGQGAEPGRFQLAQEIGNAAAKGLGALPDLEWREGVNVDIGHRFLDRPADREICRPGVFRMDPALHAHLCRAALPGFLDPPLDLGEVEVIGPSAQIFAELTFRKGAELTAEIADVRVVDVAGYDVADDVTVDVLAQLIGCATHRIEIRAARPKQLYDVGHAERISGHRSVEYRRQLPHTLPLRGPLPIAAKAGRGAVLVPRPACKERVGVWGYHDRGLGSGACDPIIEPREPISVDCAKHSRT